MAAAARRALVTELVAGSYGALQFCKRYADTVLTAVLGAYLLYGIAFEAHQQTVSLWSTEIAGQFNCWYATSATCGARP